MLRAQGIRHMKAASARSFASEAKEAAPAVAAVAAPKPVVVKKGGSSFFQRLTSFAVGVAVGAGYGLYQLTEDVDKSTQEIQKTIGALKEDVVAQNAALTKRIEALEKRQ